MFRRRLILKVPVWTRQGFGSRTLGSWWDITGVGGRAGALNEGLCGVAFTLLSAFGLVCAGNLARGWTEPNPTQIVAAGQIGVDYRPERGFSWMISIFLAALSLSLSVS